MLHVGEDLQERGFGPAIGQCQTNPCGDRYEPSKGNFASQPFRVAETKKLVLVQKRIQTSAEVSRKTRPSLAGVRDHLLWHRKHFIGIGSFTVLWVIRGRGRASDYICQGMGS